VLSNDLCVEFTRPMIGNEINHESIGAAIEVYTWTRPAGIRL